MNDYKQIIKFDENRKKPFDTTNELVLDIQIYRNPREFIDYDPNKAVGHIDNAIKETNEYTVILLKNIAGYEENEREKYKEEIFDFYGKKRTYIHNLKKAYILNSVLEELKKMKNAKIEGLLRQAVEHYNETLADKRIGSSTGGKGTQGGRVGSNSNHSAVNDFLSGVSSGTSNVLQFSLGQ